MSTNKTIPTTASVSAFLDARCHPRLRADAETLITLMTDITECQPVLWGPSIIGFGSYHYKYETGREGDMCALGFSVRQKELVIYLVDGVEKYLPLLVIVPVCAMEKPAYILKVSPRLISRCSNRF